ncbi:DUF4249 domain-containing protein [Parabacteroides sp. OttesenSCG-928-J18]|nr:DUF4249 domain-containing protein [Parabacteroides sp. OttesenSCG-928-J18]
MKQYSILPLIICLYLCLSGCYSDIDLEDLRTQPQLVLNSIVVAGEPVKAFVSQSWFHTDEDQPRDSLWQAEVELHVNGQLKEKMPWQPSDGATTWRGYFGAGYKPASGDRIKITARAEGFEGISAESVVPRAIPVDAFRMTPLAVDEEDTWRVGVPYRLSVTFTDPGGQEDFYFIRFMAYHPVWDPVRKEYTDEYRWTALSINYEDEPVFANDLSVLDKLFDYGYLSSTQGRAFNDELFDGKSYTMHVKTYRVYSAYSDYGGDGPWFNDDFPETPPKVYFYAFLYTFSRDYYHYMKGLVALSDGSFQNDLIDAGISEPIPLFCNVENGLGILGACSPDSVGVLLEE